ncbi:MAG: DUF2764 family protein [Chlamydiales bacterium]
MGQYYFIHSALPELKLGCPTRITFPEMMQLFCDNLSDFDLSLAHNLLTIIDLTNVYYYLTNQTLDPRGRLSLSEIEESLLTLTHFPQYLISYLEKYTDAKARIENFSEVYLAYFQLESVNSSGFMRNYLKFEMNLRIYLAKVRATRFRKEYSITISDDEYPIMDQFEDLGNALLQVRGNPLEEYQIIQKYRFDALQNMAEVRSFGINGLFAYMMQWLIIEDDSSLDERQGKQTIQKLLEVSA